MATAVQTPEEAKGIKGRGSSALLTTALIFPAGLWYLVLLVAPLLIVIVFSFGNRAKNGGYDPAFTFDNYSRLLLQPERLEPFITSLWMAVAGHDRLPARGPPARVLHRDPGDPPQGPVHPAARHPVLDELPHPDLLLADRPRAARTSAGSSARSSATRTSASWARRPRCSSGLVYGYLPLMVFPLYVTLERMDRTLIEASKDLGAGPLGDVPPDHPAHRAARPHHRHRSSCSSR